MEQEQKDVSYIVFEGEMARAERRDKRQWIVIITLIIALLASNLAWIWYESQFETYYYEYKQDGEGLNNVNVGEQGDVIYEPKSTD